MRTAWMALSLLVAPLSPALAQAQLSLHLAGPRVSLGLVMPVVPQLIQVPGEPVYYAPRAHANYFFFDGFYWVFQEDRWYASAAYDGPWQLVAPEYVPAYVLRVPVRYYRAPPAYFRGWRVDDSPRWSERWGRDWEARRAGWDRWDRRSAPRPPSPAFRRGFFLAGGRLFASWLAPLMCVSARFYPPVTLRRHHDAPQLPAKPSCRQAS